ncbi:SRPBCC family protein [Paenibacillus chitinolyticus]|uniref:SRPBCC family protein n=1 Tax=Paenibacillus chitinolyticus TaxID=79263 RepID=UPI003670E444
MLAILEKDPDGYVARFHRSFGHSAEAVWSMLTENDKLSRWFSELEVGELREGGFIRFNMPDGSFEKLDILDLHPPSILEYTWGEDRVRFELYPEPEGCRLVLIEKLQAITAHTPKDLAGWHVCLEVVRLLLDGEEMPFRKEEWESWYEKYTRHVDAFLTEEVVKGTETI